MRSKLTLVITTLFLSAKVFAQQPNAEQVLPIHQKALNLFALAEYDSALLYFKQAGAAYLATNNWENVAISLANQAEVFQVKTEVDSAFHLLDKALEICKTHLPDHPQVLAKVYQVYGKVYDIGLFEYEKAIDYYTQSLQLRISKFGEENALVAQSYSLLGKANIFSGKSEEARYQLEKAESIIKKVENDSSLNLCDIYTNWGQWHFVNRTYGKSLQYFQQALSLWESNAQPDLHPSLSLIYMRMGNAHIMYNGSYSNAITCYKKGADIDKAIFGEEHPGVARFYGNIGLAYQYKEDYDRALFYYEQSLDIQRRKLPPDHPSLGMLYTNMGILHKNMKQYQKAIEYYELTETIYTKHYPTVHPNTVRLYNNYSNALYQAGNHTKALDLVQKSLAIKKELYGDPHPRLIYDYQLFAGIYRSLNQFDSTLFYNQKALDQLGETEGRVMQKGEILNDISLVYHLKGEYDKALSASNEALFHLGANALDNKFDKPELDSLLAESFVIQILRNRGLALMGLYQNNSQETTLRAAYDNYSYLDEVLQQVIGDDRTQASKIFQLPVLVSVYEKAIECALKMSEITRDDSYKSQAFQFAEKSKSVLLAQNLLDTKARKFASLPDSILLQEEVLKENLAYYKNKLSQYEAAGELLDSVYQQDKNQYLQARSNYEELVAQINNHFPSYYRLKYEDFHVTPQLLQAEFLKDNQAILEFMIGDEHIYTFCITRHNIRVLTQPADTLLEQATLNLRQGLLANDFEKYTQTSYTLYNKFFQPIEDFLQKEKVSNITIVADGYLNYLPFEALIRHSPNRDNDFSALDYLVFDYNFNYQYSSKLACAYNTQQKASVNKLLLGFAPDFSGIQTQELMTYEDITRDNLQILKGANDELTKIGKLLGGNCLFAQEATEANFKQLANQYQVIHLATHAIVDDENPSFSQLIFSADSNSQEDGHLHSYELYNLHLNADLVTLSACNTGFGKIQKGEGIMSLARGFAYAGCPNIVMSLWPASDKVTARLMETFYQSLSEGMPKDAALRKAKLEYLQSADPQEANPYYWANFVFLGEPSALKSPGMPVRQAVAIMAGTILLFSGLSYYLRNRKKGKK